MQNGTGKHHSPKTLVDRDLELITKLRRFDLHRNLLKQGHSYTVTRYTEVSIPSECYICNASHRPQARVTIHNDTVGEALVCGLDCMEKYFDLRRSDLDRTSLPLKQLASTWEAFKRATDESFSGFVGVGTKDAVEDMYQAFGHVPILQEARRILEAILNDLRSVQDGLYSVEIRALRDLLGVFYEVLQQPGRVNARAKAFVDHPLLSSAEQQFVSSVLSDMQQLLWSDFVTASQLINNISGKRLSVRLKEIVAFNYSDRISYLAAVDASVRTNRDAINQRHTFLPVHQFQPTITETINQLVKAGGGLKTFAFESSKLEALERLQLSNSMKALLDRTGVKYLEMFGGTPYEEVTTQTERISVRSMLQEGQLEEENSQHSTPKPRSGYYRGFVLCLPDKYYGAYAVWARHGGPDTGRKFLENLTSSL